MRNSLLFAVGFLLLSALDARALTTTVTFFELDSPPDGIACGQTWVENGVVMQFDPTTADDCGVGPCAWFRAHNLPGNVVLNPARLVIDAASVAGPITSVQIDIQDPGGADNMRLHLYDGTTLLTTATNLTLGMFETLQVDANGANVTHVVVSSCGGICFEVRIEHDTPVPTDARTWGAIKALFD